MERFYPSCNFLKIDADAWKKLNTYAENKGMEIAKCCRIETVEGTANDNGYYICQACRPVIEEKKFHSETLWKVFDEDEKFCFPDYSGLTVVVQDCWRDREHPEIFRHVRSLLQKMNIRVLELEANFENSDFCGRFHMETKLYTEELKQYPGITQLDLLPQELYEKLMAEQVAKYPCYYALTYCNTCYNSVKAGGGHPLHLAQLLLETVTVDLSK